VFYCHPVAGQLGGIRNAHVLNMQKSCDKYGVPFVEVGANFEQFLEDLKKNDLPRLVVIDDLADYVFRSRGFSELFNMTGHHYSM